MPAVVVVLLLCLDLGCSFVVCVEATNMMKLRLTSRGRRLAIGGVACVCGCVAVCVCVSRQHDGRLD